MSIVAIGLVTVLADTNQSIQDVVILTWILRALKLLLELVELERSECGARATLFAFQCQLWLAVRVAVCARLDRVVVCACVRACGCCCCCLVREDVYDYTGVRASTQC